MGLLRTRSNFDSDKIFCLSSHKKHHENRATVHKSGEIPDHVEVVNGLPSLPPVVTLSFGVYTASLAGVIEAWSGMRFSFADFVTGDSMIR